MSGPTSHICPECFTPRASDGTPSCACGRRASEALLEARTAEAAAAEDFDPLRIRPYVELGDENDGAGGTAPGGPGPDQTSTIAMPVTTAATAIGPEATDVRMFERRGGGRAGSDAPSASSTPSTSSTSSAASTQALFSAPASPSPYASPPSARPASGAMPTAPTPFASPAAPAALSTSLSSPSAGRSGRRRRRRAGLVVALAGTAAAGVMAAAGFASGLFSYDTPERNRALPDDLRASAPDTSPDGEASPVEPSREGGGGAPAPAPPGGSAASPSPTKSPSPSPSPSQASGSPSPSASPDPTQSGPSAGASTGSSAAGADEAGDSRLVVPKTLRLGDDDPEVTELQLRLRQLGIYNGDIDESFDSQVEQAVLVYQTSRGIAKDMEEPGVYGLVTREQLESETKTP